jgi:ACS family D-galactonate transporter-like MFS transporter
MNVALLVLCQSAQSLVYGGIALFLPLIREDLGLTFTQAGTLAAASSLTYAFMQIPSGYMADRFGPRRLFAVGVLGSNALAFSFAQLHDFTLAVLNQAAAGFFRSLVFAPGLLLISALFPPRRRATAMGLFVAGGFSSNVLLSSIGPILVVSAGWRNLFMAFAMLGIGILTTYWFAARGPEGAPASPPRLADIAALLRRRRMWLIVFIQYARLGIVTGVGFWLPTFLVVDRGLPLSGAGLIVAVGALLTAPANFLGGYVSDRIGSRLRVIGASLAVLAATTFALPRVDDVPVLVAVVAVNAFFIQLYFGPLFALPLDLFGQRTAGLISGVGNFAANLGGLTFAYSLGAMRDGTGSFESGFTALAVLATAGVIATVLVARSGRATPSVAD